MLIRFWCDSDITFSRGLHKNLVTVLYFSMINVLCRAGGDASFAPQANLVYLTTTIIVLCLGLEELYSQVIVVCFSVCSTVLQFVCRIFLVIFFFSTFNNTF